MDRLSKQQRSWNMSRIRNRDTQPEKTVRSVLHRMGYRFRVNQAGLLGKPDIVLRKYRTVVFVHGCFWHRHNGCRYAYNPKSRKLFWKNKFEYNTRHDELVRRGLVHDGWHVVIIWECQVSDVDHLKGKLTSRLQSAKRNSKSRQY